eukprot:CAMPEP_0172422482 /NCGR_PEP_ID=MMETSP1064-20121228/8627_1 /TAXON_ID=202472 /ORGANISM="Aulacoseira subarctica , Strain CCAP 1002/5" /LENGTH=389 /DNA_ID=CAMNT_0013163361 /DNA_START=18 /DNA_END=1184 /DNA_ORIENTATION=-
MSAAGGPPNSFYNPNKGTNPTNFGATNSSYSNMMYGGPNMASQAAVPSGYNRTSFTGSNAAMPAFQSQTAPPRSGNANTVNNPQQQSFQTSTSSGNFNLAESGIYSSDASTTASYSQQQQQQTVPNYWNPAVLAAAAASTGNGGTSLSSMMMNSDAMILDLASSAGRTFIASGMARFVPGLERFMTSLRYYFAVDNKFVQRKIITVLFPYAKKHWRRMEVEIKQHPNGGENEVIYALPIVDENAPDLYLPTMSLVTYVILCAFLYGASGKFNPELLPDILTKCFLTQLAEVLAIRFGFYLMEAPVSNLLDFFSVTGYKYLGLSVSLLLSHFFRLTKTGYYMVFLWTATSASYLMMKVMANNIPRNTASTGPKREVMVLLFAASQLATMW